jgi:hypothetical protein
MRRVSCCAEAMPRQPAPKRERRDPRLLPKLHDEAFVLVLERSRYERLIDTERRREGGHLLPSRYL